MVSGFHDVNEIHAFLGL